MVGTICSHGELALSRWRDRAPGSRCWRGEQLLTAERACRSSKSAAAEQDRRPCDDRKKKRASGLSGSLSN